MLSVYAVPSRLAAAVNRVGLETPERNFCLVAHERAGVAFGDGCEGRLGRGVAEGSQRVARNTTGVHQHIQQSTPQLQQPINH